MSTDDRRERLASHPARIPDGALDTSSPRSSRGCVWPSTDGGPHASGYDAGLGRLRRSKRWPGLRSFRFHDQRHTAASHLIQGTWAPVLLERPMRLEEVQLWLGHASRVTTEVYAHLRPDGIQSVVRGLRLADAPHD